MTTANDKGPGRQSKPFEKHTTNDATYFIVPSNYSASPIHRLMQVVKACLCWLSLYFSPGLIGRKALRAPPRHYYVGAVVAALLKDRHANLSRSGFPQVNIDEVTDPDEVDLGVQLTFNGATVKFSLPRKDIRLAAIRFRDKGRYYPPIFDAVQAAFAQLEFKAPTRWDGGAA